MAALPDTQLGLLGEGALLALSLEKVHQRRMKWRRGVWLTWTNEDSLCWSKSQNDGAFREQIEGQHKCMLEQA